MVFILKLIFIIQLTMILYLFLTHTNPNNPNLTLINLFNYFVTVCLALFIIFAVLGFNLLFHPFK
jgi:hypothetical protein